MRPIRSLKGSCLRLVFAATVSWLALVANAQISLSIDMNDLKSKEIEAKYTRGQGTKEIVWTTDAMPMPSVNKQSNGCARIPDYMDGAICYRVCGGSLVSAPVKFTYEWRPANLGDNTPWEACSGNGCKGFNDQYYAGPARGCGHFMIWRGVNHQRDLRIKVQLQ
jgi:hypothetical protein